MGFTTTSELSSPDALERIKYDELMNREMAARNQAKTESLRGSLLTRLKENLSKSSSSSSSSGTDKYFSAWQQHMTQTTNAFNQAYGTLNEAKSYLTNLDTMSNQIGDLFTEYSSQFGDLQTEAIESSRSDIKNRQTLISDLMTSAKADLRGVSGRAMSDVGTQADIERKALADELLAYGGDPTSRGFQKTLAGSRINTALAKTMAANLARREETERADALKTSLLSQIDPTQAAAIAQAIAEGKTTLTEAQAELLSQGAAARTNIAGMYGDLASSYGSLGSQYSDWKGLDIQQQLADIEQQKLNQESLTSLFPELSLTDLLGTQDYSNVTGGPQFGATSSKSSSSGSSSSGSSTGNSAVDAYIKGTKSPSYSTSAYSMLKS